MTPEAIFNIVNPMALTGWVLLALSPFAPRTIQVLTARAIPLVFAVIYSALILVYWTQVEGGGYGSLTEVMALLSHPGLATAGWVHFLAFDLFVGAWIAQDAARRSIPHLAILPCLGLTFMFGPVGLLAYLTLSFLLSLRGANTEAATP